MDGCGPTPASGHPGSLVEGASAVTLASASEPSGAGEDPTILGQHDVKTSGDKTASVLEPPSAAPMAQPSAAVPQPPPTPKQNPPTLLKPQYKTALKDFIVSSYFIQP